MKKLEDIASITPEDILSAVGDSDIREVLWTMPRWATGTAMLPLTHDWSEQVEQLVSFHKSNGYGMYAKYAAFSWRDQKLSPITTLDPIKLTDLKNYEKQRKQVLDNTIAFLDGYPSNNVLLYGDRGTGKSSTIHAILNEYRNSGLRMIEISKGDINDLTVIRELIGDSPMKFIIYIDDLSFDSHDDSFGELKAALEGSLSGRQNDVNRSDTLQEELSLSDRFGLSVTFMNPDKKDYLDIAEKIAVDRGLDVDMDRFLEAADQWARRRGGRSPRCAKQFIDYVEGCIKRGIEW